MGLKKTWPTVVLPNDVSLSTNYKPNLVAQMQQLHDALIAVGLIQTTDTGQITDFSTIVVASGDWYHNKLHGYRVYRMNDSLASTSPIFIKVLYRTRFMYQTHSPHFFTCGLIVGSGSDGAGNIISASDEIATIGVGFTANPSSGSVSDGSYIYKAGAFNSYAYADDGVVWIVMAAGAVKQASLANTAKRPVVSEGYPLFSFCISRFADETGAALPGVVHVFTSPDPSMINGTGDADAGYTYNPVIPQCYTHDLTTGTTKQTSTPSARPCSDAVSTINGGIAVGKIFGLVGTQMRTAIGIAAVSAMSVNTGDTMSISLEGIGNEKLFFIPWRNAPAFEYANRDFPLANSTRIDTMMLQWDGDFI
ncbi:hypothetical protein [Acinetobacter johnsonii]|uniref:hypothetical protein n=1 Tax=Acinetobacter johnsonii TaxID=40214 RepID=UPI0007388E8C|nr:hypothetical protein [Acinetobacter johnsonii]KUG39247.1 hypothetical protein AAU60_06155 [Acinetobacter johnsonii]